MPNQRAQGKKQKGVWLTDAEEAELMREIRKSGCKNIAEFLRKIRTGEIKVSSHIKALALVAVGANGGCVGMLLLLGVIIGGALTSIKLLAIAIPNM